MRCLLRFIFAVLLTMAGTVSSAEETAEITLKTVSEAANISVDDGDTLEERWRDFIENGFEKGVSYEGGVIQIPERNIYLASAIEFTNVRIGQPGWIESRIAAFERAELLAKVKIIRAIEESVESSRSMKMFENVAWTDGSVEEVKNMGKVSEALSRLGNKTLALGDAALDSALKKLDPNYDPSDYENNTPEEIQTVFEDKFQRKIRSMAFRTSIGVTPAFNAEGESNGEYQVIVGVIWSPNLNKLALSLFNDEYRIPPAGPGKTIEEHVPNNLNKLLSLWGTRIVVDEKGDYTLIAYAQAQPRKTTPGREQRSLQLAKQIASERARAQIVNYIREGLTFSTSETGGEISRAFSDMTDGTEVAREFKRRVSSNKTKVKLRGVHVVREWSIPHPETGQIVAGAVVAWSPSSAMSSNAMGNAMKSRPQTSRQMGTSNNKKKGSEKTQNIIESMPVDTSVY